LELQAKTKYGAISSDGGMACDPTQAQNYCLRERENGWNDNNRDSDQPISYTDGSYCELHTRNEWGSYSPLTCPVVKHGVMSAELTKHSKNGLKWGNASDIQMKRTTQLRHENVYYSRIDSDVLQRNIARLDAAFRILARR
jgi:putative transposase